MLAFQGAASFYSGMAAANSIGPMPNGAPQLSLQQQQQQPAPSPWSMCDSVFNPHAECTDVLDFQPDDLFDEPCAKRPCRLSPPSMPAASAARVAPCSPAPTAPAWAQGTLPLPLLPPYMLYPTCGALHMEGVAHPPTL
jgi:hypothetical protein